MAAVPNSEDHLPKGSNFIYQIAICPITRPKSEQENFHKENPYKIRKE